MIFKYDYRYAIAKHLVDLGFRCNFRKVVYVNKENIPDNVPIVYAPTHRNAVIDGLTLVNINKKKQIVFLARADIFSNKTLSWILSGLKVMPVYRIRDGKDNLEKNDEIFDNCRKILEKNNPICLFPEAKHNEKQSLIPLQKGLARISLPTEATSDFTLNTNIVPVSIFYKDKSAFLDDVYVTFGKPVSLLNYKDLYNQNPNLAINTLRHEIDAALRSITVDISNDSYYNFYTYCMDLTGKKIAKKYYNKEKDSLVRAYRHIDNNLDNLFDNDRPRFIEIINDFGRLYSILRQNGLDTKYNISKPKSLWLLMLYFILLLLGLLFAINGFANAILPILFYILIRRKVKDGQFVASIRTLVGMFILPLFDILQSIALGCITNNWWLALTYFVVMPLQFYFACYWRKWFKQWIRAKKVNKFYRKNREDWEYINKVINDFDI